MKAQTAVFAMLLATMPAGVCAVDERGGDQSGLPPIQSHTGGVPSEHATLRSSGVVANPPHGASAVRDGAELYAVYCSSCHGEHLQGSSKAPDLLHAGGAAVDFYLTTGRMPLAVPGTQDWHSQPQFAPDQIAAIEAFVGSRAGASIPIPSVADVPSQIVRGREIFEENCQACHGSAAQGASVGYGWVAPELGEATVTQVAEAVRIGPGMMPRFTRAQISDPDLDALVTYVNHLATAPENPGGNPFGFLGPLVEGAIAWSVGIGGLYAVIYFIGTVANGVQSSDRADRRE